MNKKRLDGVCPLITDPPPNSLTTLEKQNKNKNTCTDTGINAFVEREDHCHYTILYYTKT